MASTSEQITDAFLKERSRDTLFMLDTFWRWDPGAGSWAELPIETLHGEISLAIERAMHGDAAQARALLRTLPAVLRARLASSPDLWNNDPDLLPCLNGLLHIAAREITHHDKSDYLMRTLGTMYNPRAEYATCPTWDAFIHSTVPPAEADFLQEFAGLALTFDASHEIAVWLYGPPGSGKSTFLRGLEIILGSRAGVLNLAALARGDYTAASLFGRSLLISVEQPVADLKHDHLINALVSGEPIPVRGLRQRSPATTARTWAKWIWALTSLPRVAYAGSGLFRRARIVKFPFRSLADRDPSLKATFFDEAAGILHWALAGLDRLRARGRLVTPASVLAADERYHQSNDLVAQFLAEQTITQPSARAPGGDLFTAYKAWCGLNGFPAQSNNNFAAALERLGYERCRIHGYNFWQGLQMLTTVSPVSEPPEPENKPPRKNE